MRARLLITSLLLAVAAPIAAQSVDAIARKLVIPSKVLEEERNVWIRTPPGYDGGTSGYPVLYMTDAEAQMAHTVATVAFLERNGRIPPMIVVGVGNTDRTRDLTPSRARMPGPGGNAIEFPTAGGADRFLRFLETELIPRVEKEYRALPLRVLAGHSFGGLFAVHALSSRPGLFRGMISASPALQWDDDLAIRAVESLIRDRSELPMTLVVTAGNEAEQLVSSIRRLEKTLAKRKPKGFEAHFVHYPDEDHGSIVLPTNYYGLRTIFAGWQPPRDDSGAIAGTWDDLEAHYQNLSQRFGVRIVTPEAVANQLGYQLMGRDRLDEAIEVFRANVKAYPSSANVYDSLGEALEKAGRREDAFASYGRAVELGEKSEDPNLAIYRQNRDRVKGK